MTALSKSKKKKIFRKKRNISCTRRADFSLKSGDKLPNWRQFVNEGTAGKKERVDPWVAMHLIGKRGELDMNDILDENNETEDTDENMEKDKRQISIPSNKK